MEGFRYFQDTASFRVAQSPLPSEARHAHCVPGSSSRSLIGETHFDPTLEAAFSRLKVSPFSHWPQLSSFDGDCSNGSALKYPLNDRGFGGENFAPFGNDESLQSLSLNNGGNGVLSHLGLEDCWVESDIDSSIGFVSNLNQHLSQNCLSRAVLRGWVAFLARDQNGSRFLQNAMEAVVQNREIIDLIFLEVLEQVSPLMLDPQGNFVVQKLIEVCSEEQRTQMLSMLTRKNVFLQFICTALDTRGTRCVQKLLKHVTTKEQITMITRALSPFVVALSMNVNGHHVVQHCLEHFSDEDNECLLLVVANNCLGIAKDKSGCCLLQKCIEHSNGEIREHLVAAIIAKALALAVDRYGNYVVQHLLGLSIPQITENLLRQLHGSYISLSCNKYGSNVVEKCLLESEEEQSSQIIFELLTNPNVAMLLLHPFGNYVIQTALAVSKGIHHAALLNLVRRNSEFMRKNQYGMKVLAWCERSSRHL